MSVIFRYYFITFVNTIHASTELTGVCSNMSDGSSLECCRNYRVVGNSCVECWPGTHGIDCMEYCPPNFYGKLCLEKCGCEPCHRVTGCSIATELTGVCSNVSDGSPLQCCRSYRVVGNSCVECWPGTFGVDCKDYCPPNFYGRLCLGNCSCEPCDKVTGCSIATDKDQSPTNYATWLTLSALAFCFVICFIFCLRIFFILRRVRAKNPTNLAEYGGSPLENSRYSMSLTSRKIDLSQTKDTETSFDKCQTTDSNNMTETASQNAYGHDDSMDGAYNILKLTVSDKNDHMQITNNNSTPLEKLKNANVYDDTYQMASTVSNIVKTENNESKNAIRREKSKHQKELFRALDEFKKGSTRNRKKLRYSFTKSTELL